MEEQQENENINEPGTPNSPSAGTVGDSTVVDSQPPPPGERIAKDRASMVSDHTNEEQRPPSRSSSRSTSDETDLGRNPSLKIAPPDKAPGDDSDDDADEDMDEHAFDHPSTYKPAPWIWVPKDTLGLSDVFLQELRALHVDGSDLGAFMDEKARVRVTSVPRPHSFANFHLMCNTLHHLTDVVLQYVILLRRQICAKNNHRNVTGSRLDWRS